MIQLGTDPDCTFFQISMKIRRAVNNDLQAINGLLRQVLKVHLNGAAPLTNSRVTSIIYPYLASLYIASISEGCNTLNCPCVAVPS